VQVVRTLTPAASRDLPKEDLDTLRRPIFPEGQYINPLEQVCIRATYGKVWYDGLQKDAPEKIMVFLEGTLLRPTQ